MQNYIITLRKYPEARHMIRAASLAKAWDGLARQVGFTSFRKMCEVQRLDQKEHKRRFIVEVI